MRAPRGLPWIPALILLALALHHGWRVHADGLTPWKGGGFGMFATTDGGHTRRLELLSVDAAGEAHVFSVPAPLGGAAQRARSLPSDARLRDLALQAAPHAPGHPAAVRVVVWRTRFDPESLAPRFEPLRSWAEGLERDDP